MKKLLKDDLGRIVGAVEVKRNATGNIEYGRRDADGVFHVEGIAKIVSISSQNLDADAIENLRVWDC